MTYFNNRDADRARRNMYAEQAKPVEITFPSVERAKAERAAGISTEVDNTGRIVAATLPSKSNPHIVYGLERSVQGKWMHIDSKCPAWVKGQPCWHIATLNQLTEETE
jgi:hypothetical protein